MHDRTNTLTERQRESRSLLSSVLQVRGERHAAEVTELDLVADFAEAYRAGPQEQLVALAGDGTPAVSEFAVLELGAFLRISEPSAGALICAALALRHRLPRVLAACRRGQVEVWVARKIAELSGCLSQARAEWLDERLARQLKGLPAPPTAHLDQGAGDRGRPGIGRAATPRRRC